MGDWAGRVRRRRHDAGQEIWLHTFAESGGLDHEWRRVPDAQTQERQRDRRQTLLAHVVFTPEAQLEFNIKKGSNPIRQDVDVSSMDICAQHAAAVLKNPANQIPNPQMLLSSDAFAAVRDVII